MKLSRRQLRRLIESTILQEEISGEDVVEMFNAWIGSSLSNEKLSRVRPQIKTIIGGIKAGNYEKSLSALQGLVAKNNLNDQRDEYKKIIKTLEDLVGKPDTKGGKQAAKKKKRKKGRSDKFDQDVLDIQEKLNKVIGMNFINGDYQGKKLSEDGEWGDRTRSAASKFLKELVDDDLTEKIGVDKHNSSKNLNIEKDGGEGSWRGVCERLTETEYQSGPVNAEVRLHFVLEKFLKYMDETNQSKVKQPKEPNLGQSEQFDDIDFASDQGEYDNYYDNPTSEDQVNILNMAYDDLKSFGFWRELINLGDEKIKTMSISDFVKAEIKIGYVNPVGNTGGVKYGIFKKANSAIFNTEVRAGGRLLLGGTVPVTLGCPTDSSWKSFDGAAKGSYAPIQLEFPTGGYDVTVNGETMEERRLLLTGLVWTGSKKDKLVIPKVDLKYLKEGFVKTGSHLSRTQLRNLIEENLSRGSLYRRRYRRY